MNVQKRRNELDYSRGIAILLILIGHTNGISSVSDKLIYSFHVPLFFFISGILIGYNHTEQRSWKSILKGWVRRLIIPSVIWESILSLSYLVIKDIPLQQLLRNSLTLNLNLSVLWFIPCMMLAEALWILLLKLLNKHTSWYLYLFFAIAFALVAAVVSVTFMTRVLVAAAFVVIGYCFEKAQILIRFEKCKYRFMILIGIALLWIGLTMANVRVDLSACVFGNPVLYYLHSILGSITVVMTLRCVKKEISLLQWIGRNSFGFLVTHVFVRHVIIAVEERVFGQYYGGWSLALFMILVDMVVVWGIGRFVPEIFGLRREKQKREEK